MPLPVGGSGYRSACWGSAAETTERGLAGEKRGRSEEYCMALVTDLIRQRGPKVIRASTAGCWNPTMEGRYHRRPKRHRRKGMTMLAKEGRERGRGGATHAPRLTGGRYRRSRLDMWYRLESRTAGTGCRRSWSKSGGSSMTSTTDAALGETGAREAPACLSVTVEKHEEVSRMNPKRIHVQNRKRELTTHTARPNLRPPSSNMPATRCRGLERWRGLGGQGTAERGRAGDDLLGMPLDGMFGRSERRAGYAWAWLP